MGADQEIMNYLLMEDSLEGFLTMDGFKIVNCNNRFAKMVGYNSREELIGSKLYELSPMIQPDGRKSKDLLNDMMKKAFSNGKYRFEFQLITNDEKIIWTKVLFIKEGDITGGVIRDITMLKNLEKNKDSYSSNLKEFSFPINRLQDQNLDNSRYHFKNICL